MSALVSLPLDIKSAAVPFLARSIEFAHQHVPNRWGLSPRTTDDLIRLNVVFPEVLTIGVDAVRVFVNQEQAKNLPVIQSGELRLERPDESKDYFYRSSPGSRLVVVNRGKNLGSRLGQLQDAHLENIRVTAKWGGLNVGIKNAHSNEAIQEIEQLVGHALPKPLYSYERQLEKITEELTSSRFEGTRRQIFSSKYERNSKNRDEAVKCHGVTCRVCGFNFESFYGEHGSEYIQVHHLKPLCDTEEKILVNPLTDLDVVCANCHVMIHRDKMRTLTLGELQEMVVKRRKE